MLLVCAQSRDTKLEKELREIRNTLGAHIDLSRSVSEVQSKFNAIDLGTVHDYAQRLVNTFFDACKLDLRTRTFCLHNVPIRGVVALERDSGKPFDFRDGVLSRY